MLSRGWWNLRRRPAVDKRVRLETVWKNTCYRARGILIVAIKKGILCRHRHNFQSFIHVVRRPTATDVLSCRLGGSGGAAATCAAALDSEVACSETAMSVGRGVEEVTAFCRLADAISR